jgi:hypothetical protein
VVLILRRRGVLMALASAASALALVNVCDALGHINESSSWWPWLVRVCAPMPWAILTVTAFASARRLTSDPLYSGAAEDAQRLGVLGIGVMLITLGFVLVAWLPAVVPVNLSRLARTAGYMVLAAEIFAIARIRDRSIPAKRMLQVASLALVLEGVSHLLFLPHVGSIDGLYLWVTAYAMSAAANVSLGFCFLMAAARRLGPVGYLRWAACGWFVFAVGIVIVGVTFLPALIENEETPPSGWWATGLLISSLGALILAITAARAAANPGRRFDIPPQGMSVPDAPLMDR